MDEPIRLYQQDHNDSMDVVENCSICLDNLNNSNPIHELDECKHKFHKTCLKTHVEINNKICPMCRKNIENEIVEEKTENEWIINPWIINPLTKRRVKIGSRTYKYLKENNVI